MTMRYTNPRLYPQATAEMRYTNPRLYPQATADSRINCQIFVCQNPPKKIWLADCRLGSTHT